jgi:DNA-binding XRE family transcriptional regulator
MTFGGKLQLLRKQRNMSQEELAEKLEVSRSAVSRWETDQSIPELNKLLAISELFSASLDYLLKDDPLGVGTVGIGIYVPAKTFFTICTTANIIGLIVSMIGWHGLQSPFPVITGILVSILSCLFFEIFHPKRADKAKERHVHRQFYAANMLIILPTPIYITVEILRFGEYYDIVAPHIVPFAVYMAAVATIAICMVRQNRN